MAENKTTRQSTGAGTATAKQSAKQAEAEAAVQAKIAAMPAPFSVLGERLHALILRSAPALQPTVWYGMPAYTKDGNTICFFRADKKYMTFGFTQEANLAPEQGAPHQLMESAWFFAGLDDATEARLSAIVRRVAS